MGYELKSLSGGRAKRQNSHLRELTVWGNFLQDNANGKSLEDAKVQVKAFADLNDEVKRVIPEAVKFPKSKVIVALGLVISQGYKITLTPPAGKK